MEHLTKLIAISGLYSRRKAEELIRSGKVFVNGKLAELGQKAEQTDKVQIENKVLNLNVPKELISFNKPSGFITSHNDEKKRKTIFDILPRQYKNFHYIGRLDFKSAGLLLLTNDAGLKKKMEEGDFVRQYKIKVFGNPSDQKLKSIENGITIDKINYKGIKTEVISSNDKTSWLYVWITEGKNREVRKVFDFLELPVNDLIRISYGNYELKHLEKGKIRKETFPK